MVFKMFVLFVGLLTSVSAFAASAADRELGSVILAERTFALNIDDCENNYTVFDRGQTSACAVRMVPQEDWDNSVEGFSQKFEFKQSDGKTLTINLTAQTKGYIVFIARNGGGDMAFNGVKGYVKNAFDQVNGSLKVIVQTLRK